LFDVIDDAELYEAVLMMLMFVSKIMTAFDAAPGWTKSFGRTDRRYFENISWYKLYTRFT